MVNVVGDTSVVLVELDVRRTYSECCLYEDNSENQADDVEYEGAEELDDEAVVECVWDHGFLATLGEEASQTHEDH